MSTEGGVVDLERLSLSSGEAEAVELEISLEPIALGGEDYRVKGDVSDARLDVSRTTTGHALRLRLNTDVEGPCVRCLEHASVPIAIDAREVDQPGTRDEELLSPYVTDQMVDVEHWANDALVLALPAQPLCRDDCAGLCGVCGEPLNDADPESHKHATGGDPRMAKLRDLKLD
jgi:uncharacterized protein